MQWTRSQYMDHHLFWWTWTIHMFMLILIPSWQCPLCCGKLIWWPITLSQERPLSSVIRSVGVDRPSPVCFTVIRAKERERRGTGEAAEWYWRLLSNRRPEIVVMMLSLSIGGGGGIRNLGLFLLFIRLADIFAKNSSTSWHFANLSASQSFKRISALSKAEKYCHNHIWLVRRPHIHRIRLSGLQPELYGVPLLFYYPLPGYVYHSECRSVSIDGQCDHSWALGFPTLD